MHGSVSVRGLTATAATCQSGSEKSLTVQTDSDDNSWFSGPARDLLGSDTGLALHVLTGISESSGYRYASGERPIPSAVLRQLLHGPQGEQWLAVVMHGCTAAWWIRFGQERSVGVAALAELRKLTANAAS